jgi:hypothetical protein
LAASALSQAESWKPYGSMALADLQEAKNLNRLALLTLG